MAQAIVVNKLRKSYGNFEAVNDISFSVEQGHLFAFLGPNGAGKSTTINIICTLLEKNSGQVLVDNYEVGSQNVQVRKSIGVVFQDNVLDMLLTVKENLLVRGGLYGASHTELMRQLAKVSDVMGISDILNRPYGKLSGGQKRRAEIARALMNEPKILILDEPTTGLDPQTRMRVWENITALQNKLNMTVFLTTHYMEEAANADFVAVIDHGVIIAEGSPAQLRERYTNDTLHLTSPQLEGITSLLTAKGYKPLQVADTLSLTVKNSLEAYEILKQLEGQISSFEVLHGRMDDMFVNLTGHAIREEESV